MINRNHLLKELNEKCTESRRHFNKDRVLTIISEEESSESKNDNEYLHFEAIDNPKDSLEARNLDEWLALARGKSMSESNLDCVKIPLNNLRGSRGTIQDQKGKRRLSMPQEIFEKQLNYIMEKERQIQKELNELEEEKRKLQEDANKRGVFNADDFHVSKQGDFAESKLETKVQMIPTEVFREKMFKEYVDKFSELQDRKHNKVIKLSTSHDWENNNSKKKEIIHPIQLEEEFMKKVREKKDCLKTEHNGGHISVEEANQEVCDISTAGTSDNQNMNALSDKTNFSDFSGDELSSAKSLGRNVVVLDGVKVGLDDGTLPKHLQEFIEMSENSIADIESCDNFGIWSPGQKLDPREKEPAPKCKRTHSEEDQLQPVWTPKSANSSPVLERKEFRAVNFQSPVLSRRQKSQSESVGTPDSTSSEPPWKAYENGYHITLDRKLPASHSSPGFSQFGTTPRLPKAQNPTITLLQKAREGYLPKGAQYIGAENHWHSSSEQAKMVDVSSPRRYEGIGPTSKDGLPLVLRTEIKEKDQSKWYKRMYDTIHKQKPHRDEYVTVRYKQKRAQYPYTSGYLSEPEPGAYDSDFTEYKYATLDNNRQRVPSNSQSATHEDYVTTSIMPRSYTPEKSYSSSEIVRNTHDQYQIHPGRIENYVPGRSSISEKEAKQWWDEVMDIFDGHLEQQKHVSRPPQRSFINQALKESGYESDSTLVFRRREEAAAHQHINPKEQRDAYKTIQKGGDVPFQGLRKPAPERPKEPEIPVPPPMLKTQKSPTSPETESPRKYVENEVTIHYKTPVRHEIKEYVSEDELAHRQAEAMRKIYQEERRRKHLQELQDMNSRRHTDNFIPSQKSPIPLNRYDNIDDITTPNRIRPRSPDPRLVAKALYNFVGQSGKELTFRKGDLIYVKRQIDKNWYEGELNAMIGLFPVNYVEIVPYESAKTVPRKAHEGQARAKYNFLAQTHLELSLAKGELVTITRRVDDNWFEGKIGGRKGIFPVAYVEVLIDPQEPTPISSKPVASPAAHSLLLNGSSQGKESMGSHLYTPSISGSNQLTTTLSYRAKPVEVVGSESCNSSNIRGSRNPVSQALHIDTQSEPIPYRALYKYHPQNDDELELLEGDTVFVLEKCDDGWYVGSSERTGAFGTFPGNYVEKM